MIARVLGSARRIPGTRTRRDHRFDRTSAQHEWPRQSRALPSKAADSTSSAGLRDCGGSRAVRDEAPDVIGFGINRER